MEITSFYDDAENILVIKPIAEINAETIKFTFAKVLELSKKHTCDRIFLDIKQCFVGHSMSEGFQVVNDLNRNTGLTNNYNVAIVYNPETYPSERAQFIENVVSNRANPSLRYFTDTDKALEWLKAQ